MFTRSGSTWTQQGEKLTGGEEVGEGYFGKSVALSADGSTALIGGYNDNEHRGAAWVFTRAGSTWTQQGEKLTGGGELGFFGWSVALSAEGNTALIGEWGLDGGVGAAWVLTRSGSAWNKQGEALTAGGGQRLQLVRLQRGTGRRRRHGADRRAARRRLCGRRLVFTRSGSTWARRAKV